MTVAAAPYVEIFVAVDALTEWKKAIGQELAVERKANDLGQEDMAKRLGVSRRTLSDVEQGKNGAIDNYINYAILLDVDFSFIALRAKMEVEKRMLTP